MKKSWREIKRKARDIKPLDTLRGVTAKLPSPQKMLSPFKKLRNKLPFKTTPKTADHIDPAGMTPTTAKPEPATTKRTATGKAIKRVITVTFAALIIAPLKYAYTGGKQLLSLVSNKLGLSKWTHWIQKAVLLLLVMAFTLAFLWLTYEILKIIAAIRFLLSLMQN